MFDYRKYLIIAGALGTIALSGCGSSGSSDPAEINPGNPVTQGVVELFDAGNHYGPMSGNCMTCHATEGDGLLNTAATVSGDTVTASAEYNLCTSCHSVASHADYAFDPAAANSCSQCHDPHVGSKFAQSIAGDITREWSESGHADSAGMAFAYNFSDSCLECHSGTVFGKTIAGATAIDTSGGGQVVACGACHDLQARNDQGDFVLGALRPVDSVTFPSGTEVTLGAANNLCLKCHQGRSSKPTVDARIAAGNLGFSNIHYAAAGAVLFGSEVQGGYEYEGKSYRGRNTFPAHSGFGIPRFNDCVSCHLDNDADHHFTVSLNKCNGCHNGDTYTAMAGSPKRNYEQIQLLKNQLKSLLTDAGVEMLDGYPYFSAITTEQQLKAAYNWQLASKEPAGYIHNGIYLRQLLYDAVEDMGGVPAGSRP